MNQLYLHGKTIQRAGIYAYESMWSKKVEHKLTDLPISGQTATGYGKKIPTRYMVRFKGRWRRVYCAIFSNSGTLYISSPKGESITVQEYQ